MLQTKKKYLKNICKEQFYRQKAQASDSNINFILDYLLTGQKQTATQVEWGAVDQWHTLECEKLKL